MIFWSDISGIMLDESNKSWIHALPGNGSYKHPVYGTLNMTIDRIQRFAQSVKNKTRGIDLHINYEHRLDPSKGTKAAGWVVDAEAKPDGLWLFVDWTDEGAQSVRNREYKYISPEFIDEWEDNQGNKHKDVMVGAALTNTPFLKNLIPVNLSEIISDENKSKEEVDPVMDEKLKKALIKKFNLKDDASDEDVLKALSDNVESITTDPAKPDLSKAKVETLSDGTFKVTSEEADGELVIAPESNKQEDELAKLAESNPEVKKLIERTERLEATNRLSEVSTKLSELSSIPKSVSTKMRDALVKLPNELSDEIITALGELNTTGTVPTGQISTDSPPNYNNYSRQQDAVKKFTEAVDKVQEENDKLNYVDAIEKVATENPQLYSEYTIAVTKSASSVE